MYNDTRVCIDTFVYFFSLFSFFLPTNEQKLAIQQSYSVAMKISASNENIVPYGLSFA